MNLIERWRADVIGGYWPLLSIHCVSKNDTGVAHYNFDEDPPILIIVGI